MEATTEPAIVAGTTGTKKKKKARPKVTDKPAKVEQVDASSGEKKVKKKKSTTVDGQKKKTVKKKKFRFQRPDVLNPLKHVDLIRECLKPGEEGILRKPEGLVYVQAGIIVCVSFLSSFA